MGRESKPLKSQVNDRLFTYKLIKGAVQKVSKY